MYTHNVYDAVIILVKKYESITCKQDKNGSKLVSEMKTSPDGVSGKLKTPESISEPNHSSVKPIQTQAQSDNRPNPK